MKPAIVLDTADVKKIIAEHFGVKEDCVIKSQYTFTVITDDKPTAAPFWGGSLFRGLDHAEILQTHGVPA